MPAAALTLNGLLIGAFLAFVHTHLPIGPLLAGIVPHGIFEFPAAWIANGLGLWIGAGSWMRITRLHAQRRQRRGLFAFVRLVLPLLAVAAIIEARSL